MLTRRLLLRAACPTTLRPSTIYRPFSTSLTMREPERPLKPDSPSRAADSPKSQDEVILDRAQEGEKNDPAFTEEEAEHKDKEDNVAGTTKKKKEQVGPEFEDPREGVSS